MVQRPSTPWSVCAYVTWHRLWRKF